jgi:hypothetical protein
MDVQALDGVFLLKAWQRRPETIFKGREIAGGVWHHDGRSEENGI